MVYLDINISRDIGLRHEGWDSCSYIQQEASGQHLKHRDPIPNIIMGK